MARALVTLRPKRLSRCAGKCEPKNRIFASLTMSTTPRKEPYLMAKEIASMFRELGIPMADEYARELIRATPQNVRGKYARWSDAWTFYTLNPDWMPFSRHPERLVGKTRALSEVKG
jgi:hypothetical protein